MLKSVDLSCICTSKFELLTKFEHMELKLKQTPYFSPFIFQTDWKLRGSFFDNIVGVAAYVGWQSSPVLKPLLEQVCR